MFELFKSEMLRLRGISAVGLLALLALYYLLPKFGLWEILHSNMGFLLMLGTMALSLGFGVYQSVAWRRKNFWFFLIHRPLPPATIALSLMLAGASVIMGTITLSLLVTTLGYDAFSERVVDTRHYTYIGFLTMLGFSCYLLGTLTVLHKSKFVVLLFYVLAVVYLPQPIDHIAQYLPLLLAMSALLYLNLQCFKPDLNKPVKAPLGTALIGGGVAYGMSAVLLILTLVIYHLPLSILGSHPDVNPAQGSMKMIWKDNFSNGVGYVLADSEHPDAAHYGEQAKLASRRNLPIQQWQPPRKSQQHRFDIGGSLVDKNREEVWTFSHDQMVLLGMNTQTHKGVGALGVNGYVAQLNQLTSEDRFNQVPFISGGEFLITPSALYVLDFDSQRLLLKHATEDGEFFTSNLNIVKGFGLISTNKQLLLFDIRTLRDPFVDPYVDQHFVYPDSVLSADYGYGIEVAEGFLLMFVGENYFGFDQPGAEVFIAGYDGTVEYLGGRAFEVHAHPSWIRHYNFMIAPVISLTEELILHSIDPYDPLFLSIDDIKQQVYPQEVYVLALLIQLCSAIGLWWLIRNKPMSTGNRGTWRALGVVLGLPALVSYLVLEAKA